MRRPSRSSWDAMQVTESEQEAHDLLSRATSMLDPGLPPSWCSTENKNSHDRLESSTPVHARPPGLDGDALRDAEPRSCLAVRFGPEPRGGRRARAPLLECELCGKRGAERSTCQPLLVSGEVIGSVLVEHVEPPGGGAIGTGSRNSVVQAAPVLANLRNLAVAELRAATDLAHRPAEQPRPAGPTPRAWSPVPRAPPAPSRRGLSRPRSLQAGQRHLWARQGGRGTRGRRRGARGPRFATPMSPDAGAARSS